jgi:membrane protease YdiL (CAAX protease family)
MLRVVITPADASSVMSTSENGWSVEVFERHPVTAFFAVAVGASWLVWVPVAYGMVEGPTMAYVVAGGFGPAIAGAVVTKATGGSVRSWLAGLIRGDIGLRWYLVALALPLVVVAGNALALVLLGISLDFSVLPGRTAGYLFAFAFALLLGGGQEELGWRGFALPRLQRAHGPMAASLVIGVVWAVWHLPLFAMEGTSQSQVPFLAYAPAVVAMSVIFTWLYNESAGCILPVMLLHAGINSTGTLIPVSVDSVSEALHSQLAMAELAVLVGIALVVLLAVGWSLGIEERTGVGPTAESRSVPGDSGPGHSGN